MRISAAWFALAATVSASAGDWPAWRGPDGTGVSSETGLPLTWSSGENVRWKASLPETGNSSPIVWGERVFVTQALGAESRRTLMCFDRADGRLLWQSGTTYTEREPTHQNNPYCSATPVTDGERVIASFGSAGLYCYDFSGKELWRREFGKMTHVFGNASSPILCGDLCILNFGPDEKARLVAVDKRTGQTAWEIDPPEVDPSEGRPRGGFAGPGGFGGAGRFSGPGGPRGRGGFGPGMFIGRPMLEQADKDGDGRVTEGELAALADAWLEKLDPEKAGELSQERFTEKLAEVLPAPEGFGPPGGGGDRPGGDGRGGDRPGEGRGAFSPARIVGPGLFAALDADKDGSLSPVELKTTFRSWFAAWDEDKSGAVDEDEIREGLNASLPQLGGPGRFGRGGPQGFGGGGSWSTPILIKAAGRDELFVAFPNRLAAHDPKTGKQLWFAKGLGGTIYTTPLFGEGTIVGMSGDMSGGVAIAVRPGGTGDVTETHRLWVLEDLGRDIGSGVIHDGRVYFVGQDGSIVCADLKTGKQLWKERLRAAGGGRGGSWSSALLADGKIYLPNQAGTVFVLRPGPELEILATNAMGEPTNASMAVSNGELFLRTSSTLWCLGKGK